MPEDRYPLIWPMAEARGADIYFVDATHIRSDHHAVRTWGMKGETPVVATTGARHAIILISPITSKGRMLFMVKPTGGLNAHVFIEILNRLQVGSTRSIFLFVDRGPAHRAKKTKPFVLTRYSTGCGCSSCRLTRRIAIPDEVVSTDLKSTISWAHDPAR